MLIVIRAAAIDYQRQGSRDPREVQGSFKTEVVRNFTSIEIFIIRPDNRDLPKRRAVVCMPNSMTMRRGVEPSFLYQLERWMVPGWSTVQESLR